jgi:putative DNA primase/helicase
MQNEETGGAGSSSRPPPTKPRALDELADEFAGSGSAGGPVYVDGKPIVRWVEGELPRVVDEAEAALLADRDIHIYQRGPMLVRVVRRPAMSVRNFKRPAGALGIVAVDRPHLIELMTRAGHFERFDARKGAYKAINCPEQVAATYMSRGGHWNVPPLLATISAPTLRPDGSVLQIPGYDRAMATWYDPGGLEFPIIPERPTFEEAEAALCALRDIFKEFPFVGDADTNVEVCGRTCTLDESVFLSMLLAAGVRRSLDAAPLLGISAPDMQSGKSLLGSSISLTWQGIDPTVMRLPDTDEEAAKAALAFLLEGDACVMIDNIERPLEGDWLCVILTNPEYSGRLLGRTEIIKVPTSTMFVATGNHLTLQGDLRTRALLCRIDAKVANPGARVFERDLNDWIPRHRPELVAAALTIMRAWMAQPEDDRVFLMRELGLQSWSRFERWSQMCRAPLVWLGCPDPALSLKLLEQADPKRIQLVQLLSGWLAKFGDSTYTASDVLNDLERTPVDARSRPWEDVLKAVAMERGEFRPKKLSHYLSSNAGRRLLIEEKGRQSMTLWFEHAGQTSDRVALWRVSRAGA